MPRRCAVPLLLGAGALLVLLPGAPALARPATEAGAGAARPAAVTAPSASAPVPVRRPAARPLAGVVIALDPGHQLGNSNPRFRTQLAQKRFNGRVVKGCNTTGTRTTAGLPESTFTWRVAVKLRAALRALGATVPMTRTVNSWHAWGPCVWTRGQFGAKVGARLMVQIHADGAPSSAKGFHLIAPGLTRGWTDARWRGQPIWKADVATAKAMRRGLIAAGVTPSTYVEGQIAVRTDQTGLNVARIPTVTVELGNMRNAAEARRMSSDRGQDFYARALLRAVRTALAR